MNNRLNHEKRKNISFDTFNADVNSVLNNKFNYGLRKNQFTSYLFDYDQYLSNNTKLDHPFLLNASSVLNYDFGFGSWLKVVFFTNRMKINVVDNSSRTNVNSSSSSSPIFLSSSSLDKLEIIQNEQQPHQLPLNLINNSEVISQFNSNISNISNINKNNTTTNTIQPSLINKSSLVLLNIQDYAWLKHLLAGATAGVASRTCTAPLDRIKVLLQVKSTEIQSIRSCYRFIKEEGGYRSFWRGNGINCLKIAPEIAFRFMFYEQFKRYIKGDSDRQLAIYERLISGSLAGSLSQSIIYPMEVIKTRLCIRTTGQYNGIADAMRKIYKIEGYRTFYRGFCVNLAGILPYSGIDLTVYETLKNFYLGHFQDQDPSVLVVLFCGITSNISGQMFSYPLALVRTRLQAIDDKQVGFNTIRKQIYNSYGVLGFYRGFFPNLIKVAPANAITYIVYERIRRLLNAKMS